MSLVTTGTLVVRGVSIAAGHSMMPGTRRPPSYTVPLLPRSLVHTQPSFGVPLSLQYHSSVLSRSPLSRK